MFGCASLIQLRVSGFVIEFNSLDFVNNLSVNPFSVIQFGNNSVIQLIFSFNLIAIQSFKSNCQVFTPNSILFGLFPTFKFAISFVLFNVVHIPGNSQFVRLFLLSFH